MPLDNFQKLVAKIIAPNRTRSSPIAGGSMIQRHAFRLSEDSDIFVKDEDINSLFEADMELLERAGLYVEKTKEYPGFVEAMVASHDEDNMNVTRLQWVAEGLNGFFPAIKDEEVGFRLHFADLAVNKLIACAGRKELRDFVDMWMIDEYALPLWRVALAAPGKDARWSPRSIIEKMASNMVFSRQQFEEDIVLIAPIDPETVLQGLMTSIEEAREILDNANIFTIGHLAIQNNEVVNSRIKIDNVEWIGISPGGNPEMTGCSDENLIQPIIEKFGQDGANITDSLTFP